MGQLLARHVLNAAVNPMVYITNGGISGIKVGENVTFEAHITGGGMPGYTYQWSIKEEGDPSWSAVGENSSTWMWSAENGDEGTYDIRCNVIDNQGRTGDVIWKGFSVVSLYVSTGNFYQQGELDVQVVTIPDTTAPVELDIYTPTAPASYPVIIFQHGFTGSIKGYETISTHLASHGFVVVLPQMYPPGDFGGAPTPEEEASLGVQLISWVEAHINNHISVTADTDLLGLAGHSRGGQTAYRMALEVPEKVEALAGVDPVDGLDLFGQTQIISDPLTFDIPTYILGTGLGPVPVGESGPVASCAPAEVGPNHFYCGSPNPTWLVTATTHGHADMIDEEDFSEFCPGGPDRDGMRALTGGTLAAFFSGILQENTSALSALSDPGSAPVPVTMEMNKTGDACGGKTPPSAIPTLSEWGMIIFMTIIVGISVVILSRRRMV
jgi:chlorophyllase